MFLPWAGLFDQIKLADVYVHYDDVQMPIGRSFMSRVQIKTPRGSQWLSASIDRGRSKSLICETFLMGDPDWRERHLNLLQQNYHEADQYEYLLAQGREPRRLQSVCDRAPGEMAGTGYGIRRFFSAFHSGLRHRATDRYLQVLRRK
jgi:hypothetical protein